MPLLTPQLLFKLKSIIAKHHNAFVVNTLGKDSVPPEVVAELERQGLITPHEGAATDAAYLYGQVMAALEDPKVATWSAAGVRSWLREHPIPLSAQERQAAQTAKMSAAVYCQGLGNVVEKETGQLLVDADHKLAEELAEKIQDATAASIEARQTVKQLKADLGWATQDWTRNLDRIAITEKQNAMQAGVADGIQKRHGDALVAKVPRPDACPTCKRLNLGEDGAPRIVRLSELGHVGCNVGRRQADWVASAGTIHPHCQCQLVRVPDGWGFDETGSLIPGGRLGHQARKSQPTERFILQKGPINAGAQTADADRATLTAALESDRGSHAGAGANLQARLPPRPIGGVNDVFGMKEWLLSGQPRTSVIHRDKRAYEFDADNPDAIFTLNLQQGVMDSAHDPPEDTMTGRQTLERQTLANTAVPRNSANPGWTPQGSRFLSTEPEREPVQVADDEDWEDWRSGDAVQKGDPRPDHKYLRRTGYTGHWVYTYAEKHGGKVHPHPADETKVAVKVPKEHALHLVNLKVVHGLAGDVQHGVKFSVLPMSTDELDRLAAIHAPAAPVTPKVTAPVEQLDMFATPPPAAESPAEKVDISAEPVTAVEPAPVTPEVTPPPVVELVPEEPAEPEDTKTALNRQRAREVGEHVESSRKDRADLRNKVLEGRLDEVTHADAARFLRKESLMPVLDAAHLRELGATPGGAHMSLAISAMVASKPPDNAAGRKAYMEGVRWVAGAIQKIRTVEDAETFQKEVQEYEQSAGIRTDLATPEEVAALRRLSVQEMFNKETVQAREAAKMSAAAKRGLTGLAAHNLRLLEDSDPPRVRWYDSTEIDQRQEVLRALGTRFIAGFNLRTSADGSKLHRKRTMWGSDTGFGKALRDAKAADAKGWDAYLTPEEKAETAAKETKERAKPWRQSISELPEVAGTVAVVERGDARRLQDDLGLRAVQPGENIPDDEYEYHLRHAEMAMRDMADVLGVTPKELSLNGRLALAFAARGRGKFAAHYEPDRKAINITRFRGAGTLAHEWGHFLDNIMAEAHGGAGESGRGSFASETHGLWDGGYGTMPRELGDAFRRLHQAIHQLPEAERAARAQQKKAKLDALRADADKLRDEIHDMRMKALRTKDPADKAAGDAMAARHEAIREEFKNVQKTGTNSTNYASSAFAFAGYKNGYWNQGTEMFARAFEAYIQDKLEDTGTRRNSYLVDGTRVTYPSSHKLADGSAAQVYPQGEERKRINAAFDALVAELRAGGHLRKALAYAAGLTDSGHSPEA